MRNLFFIALFCFLTLSSVAQTPGTLDETFADNGIARLAPSDNMDVVAAILVQDDGKILTVGKSRKDGNNYSVYVSRQNVDGSLDTTYGIDGYAFFRVSDSYYLSEGRDAVLGKDGSLLIAGHVFDPDAIVNKSYILSIDENGFENINFGDNGYVFSEDGRGIVFEGIDIDSHGRIIVSGYRDDDAYVARYRLNGQIDPNFGDNGEMSLQLDPEYSMDSFGWDVKVVENDNILVGISAIELSTTTQCAGVWKLDSSGDVVETFGENGVLDFVVGNGHEYTLALDMQGDKYIVAGHSWLANQPELTYETFVTRVTKEGAIDETFGENGYTKLEPYKGAANYCYGIEVADDGQIFGVVYSVTLQNFLMRVYAFNLDSDGNLKANFGDNGIFVLPVPEIDVHGTEIILQEDGKLLISGYVYTQGNIGCEVVVARIHTDIQPEEPEAPAADVELVAEVVDANTVKVNATPNEYTLEYHVGIVTLEAYEELGLDAVVEELQADEEPLTGNQEIVFNELTQLTEYIIVAAAKNEEDKWTSKTVLVETPEGIGFEDLDEARFNIYPNPASSSVFVQTAMSDAQLSIVDMTGRCVKTVEISGNTRVSLEGINKGVYFVKLQKDNNHSIQKIVVK